MKRGIIYLITNNINGKKYVGQTTTPLSYRFTNHKSDARNNRGYYLASAIRKYGEDNFKIEALFECNE
jgi:group I intron endonuclease